jgi:hemerythrin
LRDASEFLRSYFPSVPMERINMLLNNRIVTFNPETIVTPAGEVPREIYLLLAGKVEVLTQDPSSSHFLFSGSLLAESAVIHNHASEETYRSVGFIQALRIPSDLYRNFVERFSSSTEVLEIRKVEDRLRHTYLFSDAVTNIVLHALAKSCTITRLNVGERFVAEQGRLHLIAWGRLATGEGEAATVLGKGEFWGSDNLFSAISEKEKDRQSFPPPPKHIAIDSCEICSVPLGLVSGIPVVRWKLFESFRKTHSYAAPRYRGTAR